MAASDTQTTAIRTVANVGRFLFPALGTLFCVLNGLGMEIACPETGSSRSGRSIPMVANLEAATSSRLGCCR